MTKDEFIQLLEEGTEDKEVQLNCLQYFVENYPVQISEKINSPFGILQTGRSYWTKLIDYDVRKDPLVQSSLEENFNKLKNRLDEIKKFK